MIRTLAHVCLHSRDLDRSLDFYRGALGLKRHFDFHKDGKLAGFYLQIAPGQFVEIFQTKAGEETRRQRIHHLCLEGEKMDAVRDALAKPGVAVTAQNSAATGRGNAGARTPTGRTLNFNNTRRRVRNARKRIAW